MALRAFTPRSFTLVAFESLFILTAIVVAAWLRLGGVDAWTALTRGDAIPKGVLIAAVCQLCLHYNELYDLRHLADRRELFVRILQALGSTSLVLAVLYFWFPSLIIGRGVFAIASGLVASFVVAWRVAFEWVTRHLGPRERILLVGTSPATVSLARELYGRRLQLGVDIAGFVDPQPERVGTKLFNPSIVGSIDDIPRIVRELSVDRVVVSLADARGTLPMDRLLQMKMTDGVTFDHLASVYEEYTGKIAIENLRPSWFIFSTGFRKSGAVRVAKRLIDVFASVVGLVVASPVMLAVAVAVRLSSPGPALYHQRRVGRGGKTFTVHKFRSMRRDAEATTGAVWASAGDSRITSVGRFLRKSRLDELPQLWNVLCGEMSLVGPRPERPEFVSELTKEIPFYGERHVVKPGLTGWAQIKYAYGASVEDALEKLQYDLYYIKNLSVALDLFVLFETVKTVVLRRGT
jgi:sugar transferase (PEP-CTERM system associated)